MKKFIIGVLCGMVLTILIQSAWDYYHLRTSQDDIAAAQCAKNIVTAGLGEAHVIGTEAKLDSIGNLHKSYDKEFQILVTYERLGKKKTIVVPISITNGRWVVPTQNDIQRLDNQTNAEIMR